MKLKKQHLFILLIVLLSILTYINVFPNEFVFDDIPFVVNNYDIRYFENAPDFFMEPSHGNLYRPLRSLWYMAVFKLSGLNTLGYHLNGVLMHTLVSILLFLITIKLTKNQNLSFVAALLFVAHPIHTGRVTNMTAGFDIPGILFTLLAFYLYLIYATKKKNLFLYLSFLIYPLAIFYTEEAVILPFLVILYEITFGNWRKSIATLPYFIIIGVYFIIRLSVLKSIGRSTFYFTGSMQTNILTTFPIFIKYIYKLFLPIYLNFTYVYDLQHSIFEWKFIVSALVLAAIILIALFYYNRSKLVFFSIFWFFIAMLPFTNIFPVPTLMAERYLYISSFGFCLLIALLIQKLKWKHIAIIAVSALLIFYVGTAWQRNAEWKDSMTLWKTSIEREPRSSIAHNNMGFTLQKLSNHEKAIPYFQEAIQLNPKYHTAYQNLGASYAKLKQYDLAKANFEKAIEIWPDPLYKSLNNLGLIYDIERNYTLAIGYFEKAIAAQPNLHKAHMDLAKTLVKIGDFERAEKEFKTSIALRPEVPDPHYNYGIFLEFQNRTAEAEQQFKIAYDIDPDNPVFARKYK